MFTKPIPAPSLFKAVFVGAIAIFGSAGYAFAGDAPDKSQYTLLAPTPDKDLRDFSPDRPTRSISPYTVDAGHFQIESDFLSVTHDSQGGIATRTFEAADPVLKLGLTNSVDFEVATGGFNDLRMTNAVAGTALQHARGYGDTTFAAKINFFGDDGGDVAVALAPYVISPTGVRGITAGQFQGGVIAPASVKLPKDFSLTLQTEVDALANVNGPGTHAAFTNIVGFNHPVPGLKDLTAFAEFYSQVTTERRGDNQYTFDVALAYQVGSDTQFDAGANLGLNRGAPDYQVYSGVAHRF